MLKYSACIKILYLLEVQPYATISLMKKSICQGDMRMKIGLLTGSPHKDGTPVMMAGQTGFALRRIVNGFDI